ncbi:MAG: Crp/Fnr family transcriptional regulator [Chitinophagaceae bacterium]
MEELKKALAAVSPLSEKGMNLFLAAWQCWKVPRDHFLLREHQVADHFYFIRSGIARIYYHKAEKEITEWIAMENQFFLSINSFFERIPSRLIIQTLEPAEVWGIHYNDLMKLAAAHHEIETLLRKLVTLSLILSQYRMDSIQFETAQQRYDALVKNYPAIIKRVPLTYIASFLGITLETLSRIRSSR